MMETFFLSAVEHYDVSDALSGIVVMALMLMMIFMNGPVVKVRWKY